MEPDDQPMEKVTFKLPVPVKEFVEEHHEALGFHNPSEFYRAAVRGLIPDVALLAELGPPEWEAWAEIERRRELRDE